MKRYADDKGAERAAKLLLEGAIMLQDSCPVCRSPIYQLKTGSLYCATCDMPVIREGGEKKKKAPDRQPSNSPIQKKIQQLAEELERSTDPDRIRELSKTIHDLEKILES